MIRAGSSWCDLAKHADGRVELVFVAGTHVFCERRLGNLRWTVDAGQALLYLRAAANASGKVCAIGQGHADGQAWIVIEGRPPLHIGPTHGVFPVAVVGNGSGWRLFVQTEPALYEETEIDGDGRIRSTIPMPFAPTSQGFLYVASNGTPITQDLGRGAIPGLALPSPAPSDVTVWAGQSMSGPTLALFDSTTGAITSLNTPGGQPPHVVESGGTFYVCSYVEGGAWLSTHRRPFAAAQPPPVEPPPVTPPVEPPKETPVRLESKHSALIGAFAAKFPPPGHDEDALRDHWTPKLVEQMVFSFPNEGWCWKSTSPGSRPSSDVIARQVSGGMWGYDLIPGAGTSGWRLETTPGPIDLRTQAPIRMNPVNHLGGSVPVDPGTPPVTPPPSQRPFPTGVEMPEDVALSVIDGYLAGIRERDKVRAQDVVPSRGALMYLFAVFFRELSSWIVEKQRAPQGVEWWDVRTRIVSAAVKYYQDRQGVD